MDTTNEWYAGLFTGERHTTIYVIPTALYKELNPNGYADELVYKLLLDQGKEPNWEATGYSPSRPRATVAVAQAEIKAKILGTVVSDPRKSHEAVHVVDERVKRRVDNLWNPPRGPIRFDDRKPLYIGTFEGLQGRVMYAIPTLDIVSRIYDYNNLTHEELYKIAIATVGVRVAVAAAEQFSDFNYSDTIVDEKLTYLLLNHVCNLASTQPEFEQYVNTLRLLTAFLKNLNSAYGVSTRDDLKGRFKASIVNGFDDEPDESYWHIGFVEHAEPFDAYLDIYAVRRKELRRLGMDPFFNTDIEIMEAVGDAVENQPLMLKVTVPFHSIRNASHPSELLKGLWDMKDKLSRLHRVYGDKNHPLFDYLPEDPTEYTGVDNKLAILFGKNQHNRNWDLLVIEELYVRALIPSYDLYTDNAILYALSFNALNTLSPLNCDFPDTFVENERRVKSSEVFLHLKRPSWPTVLEDNMHDAGRRAVERWDAQDKRVWYINNILLKPNIQTVRRHKPGSDKVTAAASSMQTGTLVQQMSAASEALKQTEAERYAKEVAAWDFQVLLNYPASAIEYRNTVALVALKPNLEFKVLDRMPADGIKALPYEAALSSAIMYAVNPVREELGLNAIDETIRQALLKKAMSLAENYVDRIIG